MIASADKSEAMIVNASSEYQAPVEMERKRARRILCAIFLMIWVVAVTIAMLVWRSIPIYMLIVASIFFVALLPSMIEVVQEYDKFVARYRKTQAAPVDESRMAK